MAKDAIGSYDSSCLDFKLDSNLTIGFDDLDGIKAVSEKEQKTCTTAWFVLSMDEESSASESDSLLVNLAHSLSFFEQVGVLMALLTISILS